MSINEKISKELLVENHVKFLEENKLNIFEVELKDMDMFVCKAVFELLMYGGQDKYGEVVCDPEFRLIEIHLEAQLPSEDSESCLQPEINNYYEKLLELACENYWEKFGHSKPEPDMGRNL